MHISDITENKKVWKAVKPVLSDKGRSISQVILIENDTLITNDEEVAEGLSDYFVSITDSLCITDHKCRRCFRSYRTGYS